MNFLHNMTNHDPFCYSFRESASFDFSYMHGALKHSNLYTTDIVNQLKIIYKSQHKSKKWFWQKVNKPKFGNHELSLDNNGNICIDKRPIVFDHNFLAWIIGQYQFDMYNDYIHIFEISNKKFKEMYDDIKNNYELYCNIKKKEGGYDIEKYNNFFLTLKTGIYFTSSHCKLYKDQEKYIFEFKGKYNESYLLAETIINNEMNTNYTFAHDKYGQDYNDRLSKISFDTVLKIVNSLPR